MITVKGKAKAKKLCASGPRFKGVVRVVERYWEAGPGLVCMTYCGIGHQQMGSCGDQPQKCIICAGPHKVEDHQCGVIGCQKGKRKICVHITPKCANSTGAHTAISLRCTSRHKAEINAKKEKKTKEIQKRKEEASNISNDIEEEGREPSLQLDMDIELEENWTPSPTSAPEYEVDKSPDEIPEDRDYTQDYYC